MKPADGAQSLILHGLGIDGNTADSAILQYPKLFGSDGIRPPRLHGKLRPEASILSPGKGQQLKQLPGAEHRWRAAPKVSTAQGIPQFPEHGSPLGDILLYVCPIRIQHPFLFGDLRPKGTIQAPGLAVGYAQIYIHIPPAGRSYIRALHPGNGLRQRQLFRRYGKQLPKLPVGFLLPFGMQDLPVQLGGTDPRQAAPRRRHFKPLLHGPVGA